MIRRLFVVAATLLGLLAFTGAAGAETLGVAGPPANSTSTACPSQLLGQAVDDPSTPYIIPAGGGAITQWQTYTAGDVAGSSLTLVVLKPAATGTYTVAALDSETLPSTLPVNHIASFTPPSPIAVSAGDTLALYSTAADDCYFYAGSTPADDAVFAASGSGALSDGETVTESGASPGGYTLNLAATLAQTQDAGVQTSLFPSTVAVGGSALLRSVVTNGGPLTGPISFFDPVPSGLQIQSATAGGGSCTVSGQTVSCTISGLPLGQSTTIDVLVNAPTANTYTNVVNVALAAGANDPNSANNAASASLVVTTLPQQCIVPGLKKVALASARMVLQELGCTVAVKLEHSSITKGLVISVSASTGTYPLHQLVTLTVSEGPKKPKKHKKPKKRKRH
jgi:hypothetical protein